jgi:hypothetical protein
LLPDFDFVQDFEPLPDFDFEHDFDFDLGFLHRGGGAGRQPPASALFSLRIRIDGTARAAAAPSPRRRRAFRRESRGVPCEGESLMFVLPSRSLTDASTVWFQTEPGHFRTQRAARASREVDGSKALECPKK